MSTLHVVTLGPNDGRGVPGPLRVALALAHEAVGRGEAVEIWTTTSTGDHGRTIMQGVPVRVFPAAQISRRTLASIFSVRLVLALVQDRRRFDIVHLHFGRDLVMIPAALLLIIAGSKFVTQTHGMIEPGTGRLRRAFDRLLTAPLIRRASANLVLQEVERSWLICLGAPERQIFNVPNPVAEINTPCEPPSDLPTRTVLFLAHLRPRKNVMLFYSVGCDLLKEGNDLHFVIVGPDGGDLPTLLRELEAQDYGGRIRYVGAVDQDEAICLTKSAMIYCLPAVNEPFPISVLDAWAVATPVIMTDLCHIAPLASRAEAALVVEPNAQALKDAVRRLSQSEDLRQSLVNNASRFSQTSLSPERVYQRVQEIYQLAK